MTPATILASYRRQSRALLIADLRQRLDTDPTARSFLRSALEDDYRDDLGLTAGAALDDVTEMLFAIEHPYAV